MQVLLVEDEPSIADAVVYALESEGVKCTWASTGAAALKELSDSTPKLVLLDIGLPDINGFDLIKRIRQNWTVPVVFLTSRSSEVDQVLGLEMGADDYITKPFSPRVLSARVRMHLRRETPDQQKAAGPRPGQKGFFVDGESHRIYLNGVQMDLPRYEYGILAFLISRSPRIYSRDEIMAEVWSEPDHSFDRTVDTHIKVIRGKIQSIDPNLKPIITHRNLGYSFEMPKA